MNWQAAGTVNVAGRAYGQKSAEFEKFMDLPARVARQCVLAVGGPAPRDRLAHHGWTLVDPLAVTRTLGAYREFIRESLVDFGVAKHAYVASRSGWFSDRATCYLASGRPVLHQDTGFTDWLPGGEGVFAFDNMDDVLRALSAIDRDYDRHARAARAIAEEHFEARHVLDRLLTEADFR
jgi:hypothetical protein